MVEHLLRRELWESSGVARSPARNHFRVSWSGVYDYFRWMPYQITENRQRKVTLMMISVLLLFRSDIVFCWSFILCMKFLGRRCHRLAGFEWWGFQVVHLFWKILHTRCPIQKISKRWEIFSSGNWANNRKPFFIKQIIKFWDSILILVIFETPWVYKQGVPNWIKALWYIQ